MNIWETLGVEPGSDTRTVKRAYAARLKQTRPEDDVEGFQRLRHAYETALSYAEDADEAAAPPPAWIEPSRSRSVIEPAARRQSSPLDAAPEADAEASPAADWASPVDADTLFKAFLATPGPQRANLLAKFLEQSDFEDLRVRDAFEWCFVAHADEIDIRNLQAASALFDWEDSPQHLYARDFHAARQAISKVALVRQRAELRRAVWSNVAAEILSKKARPSTSLMFRLYCYIPSRARSLREWIHHAQNFMPELVAEDLGHDLLREWLDYLDRPRLSTLHFELMLLVWVGLMI